MYLPAVSDWLTEPSLGNNSVSLCMAFCTQSCFFVFFPSCHLLVFSLFLLLLLLYCTNKWKMLEVVNVCSSITKYYISLQALKLPLLKETFSTFAACLSNFITCYITLLNILPPPLPFFLLRVIAEMSLIREDCG